jgi:hypothetical protein
MPRLLFFHHSTFFTFRSNRYRVRVDTTPSVSPGLVVLLSGRDN